MSEEVKAGCARPTGGPVGAPDEPAKSEEEPRVREVLFHDQGWQEGT